MDAVKWIQTIEKKSVGSLSTKKVNVRDLSRNLATWNILFVHKNLGCNNNRQSKMTLSSSQKIGVEELAAAASVCVGRVKKVLCRYP